MLESAPAPGQAGRVLPCAAPCTRTRIGRCLETAYRASEPDPQNVVPKRHDGARRGFKPGLPPPQVQRPAVRLATKKDRPADGAARHGLTRRRRCSPGVHPNHRAYPRGERALLSIRPSFAATGRGWRHPMSTCRRTAPGRRARWPEIQGHAASATAGRPAMAPSRSGAQGAHPASPEPHGVLPRAGGISSQRGRKIAERGCRKATRGAGNRPGGPWSLLGPSIGCGVGTRAPVAPLLTRCQRGWWRWRGVEPRDSQRTQPCDEQIRVTATGQRSYPDARAECGGRAGTPPGAPWQHGLPVSLCALARAQQH